MQGRFGHTTGLRSAGQREVWYERAEPRLTLILVKDADDGGLSGYVEWLYEGPVARVQEQEARALAFVKTVTAWWEAYAARASM